ncbi:hypothetical protein CPB86DRAFT_778283 [Serendipita vermifera]|nr:hypothetical protein CPB86DRAFT_778283 [Serendipita vermifera]
MIIPVRLRTSQSVDGRPDLPPSLAELGPKDYAIIELQGSFEIEGDYSGQSIGILDMSNSSKPTLRVGHHLLEGKIATLAKPLALLCSGSNEETSPTSPICLNMVAIIRKKIVFSNRPTPIVGQINEDMKEPAKRLRAS